MVGPGDTPTPVFCVCVGMIGVIGEEFASVGIIGLRGFLENWVERREWEKWLPEWPRQAEAQLSQPIIAQK